MKDYKEVKDSSIETLNYISKTFEQLLTMNLTCMRNIYPLLLDNINVRLKPLKGMALKYRNKKERELYTHLLNAEVYTKNVEAMINNDEPIDDIYEEILNSFHEINISIIQINNKDKNSRSEIFNYQLTGSSL